MSALSQAEDALNAVRRGIAAGRSMQDALDGPNRPSFKIEAHVQGHFSSSPCYNQTHAETLNTAVAEVVRDRLPEMIQAALIKLEAEEREAAGALARQTVRLIGDFVEQRT